MVQEVVRIRVDGLASSELKGALGSEVSDVHFRIERDRHLETEVLLALVGLGGTGIVAIVGALTKIAENTLSRVITLESANGRKLKFPAGTSRARIDELIEQIEKLDRIVDIHMTK